MSGISGVTGGVTSYTDYGKLASGKALQSAADGAAELAIATKQETVASGLSVGSDNMAAGRDLLNISDGALANITENLQRMRELALQAGNTATTMASDREKLQAEVDGLKQGIADIADQTQYNTKNLLDGSTGELNIATDDQGH
ncbi:MAG: flagellin, partial [Lachnospiraceae bacterium]|nr:flagellin [Lachnospiraceae bacterium]